MNAIDSKLLECMRTVFPTVSDEKLTEASVETLEQWDSLATVTLAALIEESFAIEIDPEEVANLNSFRSIASFLGRKEQHAE